MSETKEDREKKAESSLISEISSLGLGAKHLDTTIDGFPDIIVMGPRAIFIEMKSPTGFYLPLYSVMETSQPVFIHKARGYGLKDIYLCVATKAEWRLYSTENLLELTMAGARIDELDLLVSSPSPAVIAAFLSALARRL